MINLIEKIENYVKYQVQIQGNMLYLDNFTNKSIEIQEVQKNKIINDTEMKVEKVFEKNEVEEIKKKSNIVIKRSIESDWIETITLNDLNSKICNCLECGLGATRNRFVFGVGNPNADIMVIGEAPGADEDEKGEPFVGRAGQLLTKILESVNFSREEVYIANIIKCRPPDNRRPMINEVDSCEPYLKKQIELIKPKFILSLGLTSVDTLLKKNS